MSKDRRKGIRVDPETHEKLSRLAAKHVPRMTRGQMVADLVEREIERQRPIKFQKRC